MQSFTDTVAIETELRRRLEGREPFVTSYGHARLPLVPRVECVDGFSISIQTGETLYCTPRDAVGPWYEVELGYPSEPMPELAEYAGLDPEGAATITETVWAYVPLTEVAALLARRGGLLPVA